MEPVQLLGIAVLLALVLAMAAKLKASNPGEADSPEEVDAGDEAGRTADQPAPETEEPLAEGIFWSPECESLILATARTIIADEGELKRWRAFDGVFLDRCLQKTSQGLVFDSEAFAALEPEEGLVRFGVAVYNACSKAAMEALSSQQRVFGRIAQVYLAALMALRK